MEEKIYRSVYVTNNITLKWRISGRVLGAGEEGWVYGQKTKALWPKCVFFRKAPIIPVVSLAGREGQGKATQRKDGKEGG